MTASTEAYIRKEEELGMRIFGLSNHIWDERVKGASYWYIHQTIAKAKEAKNAFCKAGPGMQVLFGAESEYYACRDLLGMSVEGAKEFDYVLIPFSHLHMRNEVMSDYPEILEARERLRADMKEKLPYLPDAQLDSMVRGMKEADILKIYPDLVPDAKTYLQKTIVENFFRLLDNPDFEKLVRTVPTSIAHSFAFCGVPGALKNGYLAGLPTDRIAQGYKKAAQMGAYIEINLCEVRGVNPDLANNHLLDLYKIAKQQGCQFTFGTDSHSVKGLELVTLGGAVADEMGLTKDDIAEFVRNGVSD